MALFSRVPLWAQRSEKGVWVVGHQVVLIGAVLQLVFTSVIAIVTKESLDTGSKTCALNLYPGRACDFAYVTVGFGLFWSLLLIGGTVLSKRAAVARGKGPVLSNPAAYLGLLAFFWWLVFGIFISIRGGQATDAGYPGTPARNGVITLTWFVAVGYLLFAVLAVIDVVVARRAAKRDSFFLHEVLHHGGEATAVGVGVGLPQ